MAYVRGTRSVEVELSRVQSWVETADVELYGRNGDLGVIREHRDDRSERKANQRFMKKIAAFCAACAAIRPVYDIIHGLIFHK